MGMDGRTDKYRGKQGKNVRLQKRDKEFEKIDSEGGRHGQGRHP